MFDVLTLFPESFESYLHASILGRAHENKLIDTRLWNIRDYTSDKHNTVDDTPYGGGAGMVMQIEPIDKALADVRKERGADTHKTVVLSARGAPFTQQKAKEYSALDSLTLICGRYEGIDQRVADYLADEEISIGPYVLAGGEIPALVVIESVARLLPDVLGNAESLTEESFGDNSSRVEYPQYTKPQDYNGWKVPDVLLSGNNEEIRAWRNK